MSEFLKYTSYYFGFPGDTTQTEHSWKKFNFGFNGPIHGIYVNFLIGCVVSQLVIT